MSWNSFLEALCRRREYDLTRLEIEVVMCLQESQSQTKNDLLSTYIRSYSAIEEEALTQRLKNIYKKFNITGKGHKLPQLRKYLVEQYAQYQNNERFFSEIGLAYVHPKFPTDSFGKAIKDVIDSSEWQQHTVDILQTFAPNLDDYSEHLIQCLKSNIQVRILLAWPYSEAAKLRGDVLKRYANQDLSSEISVRDYVIANLETLENIIRAVGDASCLSIKLYDTLPSLAIYRAGDYMLASPFLHGSLAIQTFQLELKLNTNNQTITRTLQNDFELMWQVARRFSPEPDRNWRNDLKILFSN